MGDHACMHGIGVRLETLTHEDIALNKRGKDQGRTSNIACLLQLEIAPAAAFVAAWLLFGDMVWIRSFITLT